MNDSGDHAPSTSPNRQTNEGDGESIPRSTRQVDPVGEKRTPFDSGRHQGEFGPPETFAESGLGKQVAAFISHLEELRSRLFRAILFILGGMVICLIFSERIVNFIISTAGDDVKLTLLTPAEGVMVYLKVGLVAGIFLSSPFWFAQLWGFISPGLYRNEKSVILPVIAASVGAFLIGAAFGYMILPYTASYFMTFAGGRVEALWSLSSYVNLALQFLLSFGVIFELPLVIYATAALGIVTAPSLRKYRRHAIVGIMILAGFITPGPDIFSQIVVAVPLLILFEVGILMAVVATKRRNAGLSQTVEGS